MIDHRLGAEANDRELIARVIDRDEEALGALYDRYHRLVYTIALRVTGDSTAAEEVLQNVFYQVWESAKNFQPQGILSAWICGIARHRAIDMTRSRVFRARGREQLLVGDLPLFATNEIDERFDLLNEGARVQAALATLSPAQRTVIELAYYGGLSRSEIALRLREPIGTVKSRLRVGLERMRTALEPVAELYE